MKSPLRLAIIVLAAGTGSRFGHVTNKVWLPLSGRRIISRSIAKAAKSNPKARLILVLSQEDRQMATEVLAREIPDLVVELVDGGKSRHESEHNALEFLSPAIEAGEIDVILIHDGARPLASAELFRQIAEGAHRHGGALPALAVDPREMNTRVDSQVVRVQTPQGFRATELLSAYRSAKQDGFLGTDTASCMEKYFPDVHTIAVPGEIQNVKITYPQDLVIAEHILGVRRYRD